MADLKTNYLGMELINPLVVSASPLSEKVDNVVKLEHAGASAIVMYSLFEEQITRDSLALDHFLDVGKESFAEALSYVPDIGPYSTGPETYLDQLMRLKDAVDIPIIASLNGSSTGKWIEYASRMETSGADAIELNLYYLPTDIDQRGADLEIAYLELVANVCAAVEIPVAVKLSPFFSSLPNMVDQFGKMGAKGVVLFNRFYQPDIDLGKLEVVPNLQLSTNHEMRLPLRWIALLSGKVDVDMALTTGVQTGADVIKAVMAGAKVAMVASELLRKGIPHSRKMVEEIEAWVVDNEYESIKQMQGSMSAEAVGKPGEYERANYMKELSSFRMKN